MPDAKEHKNCGHALAAWRKMDLSGCRLYWFNSESGAFWPANEEVYTSLREALRAGMWLYRVHVRRNIPRPPGLP